MTKDRLRASGEECLRDFLASASNAEKEQFAEFMGSPRSTIKHWLTGSATPLGENLIRTWWFLDSIGYRISELEELRTPVRIAGKLLAQRLVTFDEILQTLGFPADHTGRTNVFAILRGKQGTSFKRLEALRTFVDQRMLKQELAAPTSAPVQRVPIPQDPQHKDVPPTALAAGSAERKAMLYTFLSHASALGPVCEYVAEACTDAEKALLRNRFPIQDLIAKLRALSEK